MDRYEPFAVLKNLISVRYGMWVPIKSGSKDEENIGRPESFEMEINQDFVHCEKFNHVQELANQILLRPPQRTVVIVQDRNIVEEVDLMFTRNKVVVSQI